MLQLNALRGVLAVALWAATGSALAADSPDEPVVAAEPAVRQSEPNAVFVPQQAYAKLAALAEQEIAMMVPREARQSLTRPVGTLTPPT